MANFLYKIAQVVLSLFCLTQTHIACGKDNDIELTFRAEPKKALNEDGFFASVKDFNGGIDCGAVWISDSSLLTAASCLDRGGEIDLPNLKNSLIKIKVKQAVLSKGVYEIEENSRKETTGVAIAHPLYRRLKGMTIAYDLAVVRVNISKQLRKSHTVGTLCKKNNPNSKLIALALDGDKVTEWELEKKANKYIAIVDNHKYGADDARNNEGEEYFIDHRKQFTTHLKMSQGRINDNSGFNSELIFHTEGYGGPILDINKGRCILGIMNFAARKDGEYYITSTNVTAVINWIEYTKNYLRVVKGQRISNKLHGAARMFFWRNKGEEPDPIDADLSNGKTPGEPVHKKAVQDVTIQESQDEPGTTKKPWIVNADTIVRPERVDEPVKGLFKKFFPK